MRKATDQRDAQIISLLWTSLLPFHGGDVLCFEVKCFDVLTSVAGSGHVMVTSFDAMWWLVLCHVTWCKAMSWWWAVLLPVRRTTKYYSNTTPYYKYCSVLQGTIPILPWSTKFLLFQYYFVPLRSTPPILLRTTNTNLFYKVLLQH